MAMKVFNLSCAREHAFEGWFGSAEDFDAQLARGLVECPICADKSVRRMPTAPRLNLSGGQPPGTERNAGTPPATPTPEQLHALWMRMARHIRENTEDVGARFAEEARKIHYEEAPRRGIRGVASPEEARELEQEGIEVVSFPMPQGSNEPLQ